MVENQKLEYLELAAPAVHNTWAKKAWLFKNGLLIVPFRINNKPVYTSVLLSQDRMEDILDEGGFGWGNGFQGAFSDYQKFKFVTEGHVDSDAHFLDFVGAKTNHRRFTASGTDGDLKGAEPVYEILKKLDFESK